MSNGITSGWVMPGTQQTIAFGFPIAEVLPEAVRRLSLKRVAVVTTNSLAGTGGLAESVRDVLGDRFHSITADIRQHASRGQALRVAEAITGADGVISLGGGSVCDSVKGARLCLANDVTAPEDIDRFRTHHMSSEGDTTRPPSLPFISIPTTLSAAEFTNGAGIVDERGPLKQVFQYPNLNAAIVILDPAVTLQTPQRLLFSTGVRAVDHAVEGWCSINTNAISRAHSLYAAKLLIPGLRRIFEAPDDLQARLDCLQGAWLSVLPAISGVKSGASHGFGQALGAVGGMPHGETGCVMLPHVLRYNAAVNGETQQALAEAIGQPAKPLAEIIAELVAVLDLPSRLRDAGLPEEMLDPVAAAALKNPLLGHNPRPIIALAEARGLLQRAY